MKSSNALGTKAMTDAERERMVQEIVARPYRKVIRGDDLDGYLAEAPELPGCVTAGETVVEALELLRDAMEGWVESALAADEAIPQPQSLIHAASAT
ncbi:MAG: type II toxin-antitoxin system HicB family antitoxin [Tepidiformaceae bacterium]